MHRNARQYVSGTPFLAKLGHPCKAVRGPGPELGGREATGWGRHSSLKKWGSHAQHSFSPNPKAKPGWSQNQGGPGWGRGRVASSRQSLWESSKKGLTVPQLRAPFWKRRNLSSQISLFLAWSHVDIFSCYTPEGHGGTG